MVVLSFKCNFDMFVGGDSTALTYSTIFTRSPQFDGVFLTDCKTEEALLSYIHENYQKSVATGETVLYSSAQNMISTIKAFLKSKGTKELEVREPRCCCVSYM